MNARKNTRMKYKERKNKERRGMKMKMKERIKGRKGARSRLLIQTISTRGKSGDNFI